MRAAKPYNFVLFSSAVIFASYIVIFVVTSLVAYGNIDWIVLLVTAAIIFGISYLLFFFILKKYIYDRIKLVYKTIHTLKLTREEKLRRIDLKDDIIQEVNRDVKKWADERTDEIEKLKMLEAYRRDFLGNVSHELKTPISNIQGYILTLMEGAVNDPQVNLSYLEKTQRNVERMINLVDDLETISLLESGNLLLDISSTDIVSLARETFDLLEDRARQKNIRMIFQDGVTRDTQIMVQVDKQRIKQVLINLIDNSIKYGRPSGRTKISFYDMDENVLVEISDNGIGIDARHIERLFERFYRVDKSRSRDIGGSGLGLAIVKHIIESHHQTIHVRSTPGVGSTFSFTLRKAEK